MYYGDIPNVHHLVLEEAEYPAAPEPSGKIQLGISVSGILRFPATPTGRRLSRDNPIGQLPVPRILLLAGKRAAPEIRAGGKEYPGKSGLAGWGMPGNLDWRDGDSQEIKSGGKEDFGKSGLVGWGMLGNQG
ncbi:hypothetical protein scyTo_0026594 [Scyliorhinus torazame]|uniref:Uncharacterized protein n=1 Tax=Scyliorhinus torazame TaxID=75743 RepID=A0A401QKC5_SCYTO|nr:hypothetical protein [Scyliorhinus torazame]